MTIIQNVYMLIGIASSVSLRSGKGHMKKAAKGDMKIRAKRMPDESPIIWESEDIRGMKMGIFPLNSLL